MRLHRIVSASHITLSYSSPWVTKVWRNQYCLIEPYIRPAGRQFVRFSRALLFYSHAKRFFVARQEKGERDREGGWRRIKMIISVQTKKNSCLSESWGAKSYYKMCYLQILLSSARFGYIILYTAWAHKLTNGLKIYVVLGLHLWIKTIYE